ncbi:hypothetical protein BKA70DRAFT_1344716 [Coprinopsis sp. MPI-PUGE-AT-0042]|nr:hypothetical protein BKA70DRAFT_1344716 [Coprinopsis sp. MPI-PUGE-AT-0042]
MFNDTSAVVINGGNFASIARDAYFGQLSGTNHFDVGGDLIFNLQIVNTGNAHPSPPHRRAATTRETEPHPRDPLCPTNAGTALQDAFSHVDDCLRAIGFVQTGSRNAISSPYLEIRQYELDDSTTNAEADEQSLSGYYLGHERVLEITIRIREPAAMEGNRCSGCGHVDDVLGAYKEGVRMKW